MAAVSDEMLAQAAAHGTAYDVCTQVARLERRDDHAALCSPSLTLAGDRVRENTDAIIKTFSTAA
jgi:hypothetical protein